MSLWCKFHVISSRIGGLITQWMANEWFMHWSSLWYHHNDNYTSLDHARIRLPMHELVYYRYNPFITLWLSHSSRFIRIIHSWFDASAWWLSAIVCYCWSCIWWILFIMMYIHHKCQKKSCESHWYLFHYTRVHHHHIIILCASIWCWYSIGISYSHELTLDPCSQSWDLLIHV